MVENNFDNNLIKFNSIIDKNKTTSENFFLKKNNKSYDLILIDGSHEFKDGKFHGEWKFYYLNGEVETSGFFENGERIGEWFYYHNNGRVKANLNYLNGKPHGLWRTMDENGLVILEEEWINGIKQLDSINNPFNNVKIDGYEVKPTIID